MMPGESNNQASTLSIEGVKLVAGSTWEEMDAFAQSLAKVKVRYHAVKSGMHAGAIKKVGKKQYSYSLADANCSGLPSGDLSVSSMLMERSETRDNIVIFIYVIKSQDRYTSDKYWLVAVQPDGQFLKNYECFCDSKLQLKNEIESIEAISQVDLAYLDVQKGDLIDVFGVDKFSENDEHWSFLKSDFKRHLDDDKNQFSTIHKPVNVKANKLLFVGSGLTVAIVGFSAFSFMYQMSSNDFLNDPRLYKSVRDFESSLSDKVDSLTESKVWTHKSFKESVRKQYFDNEKKYPYRPIQVASVIREVNKTLPTYLAEWKFDNIRYENGSFFAEYHRNPTGKGVYFVLDEKIKAIDSMVDSYSIVPYELKQLANIRVYEIFPKVTLSGVGDAQENLQTLAQIKRTEAKLKDLADDASRSAKQLKRQIQLYKGLSFVDKWILLDSVELAKYARVYKSKVDKFKKEIEKIESSLDGMEIAKIPEPSLLGNELDFISMMHVDSFFNWAPPKPYGTFPDKDTLSEKKGKRKKDDAESPYKPAILIHQVTVATQEDTEDGKSRSYGVDDMLKLSFYIEKPFVDVLSVKYTREGEQWTYDMVFYRKTHTFDKFFSEKG